MITTLASDHFSFPALLYLAIIWGEDAEVPVQTAGGKGFRSKPIRRNGIRAHYEDESQPACIEEGLHHVARRG